MCFPEIDKKDLLHAIGGTFGGVLRSEISKEFCRHRINLDVQKLKLVKNSVDSELIWMSRNHLEEVFSRY